MWCQFQVCNSKKTVGEEIARLKHAVELFKTAQVRAGDPSLFEENVGRAQRALDEAVKDNNFIYHEAVPDVRYLMMRYFLCLNSSLISINLNFSVEFDFVPLLIIFLIWLVVNESFVLQ